MTELDFFGKEIKVGDRVVYIVQRGHETKFRIAWITEFTAKKIKLRVEGRGRGWVMVNKGRVIKYEQ